MRIPPTNVTNLGLLLLLLATGCVPSSVQAQGRLQSRPPITGTDLQKLPATSTQGPTGLSSANAWGVDGPRRGSIHRRREADNQSAINISPNGIPYWTDSFSYQGLEFTYTMVGTDPKKGSQTTIIPTVIIPLTFVFPNGSVYSAASDYDGDKTVLQRIIESPIFQNHNYVLGGTTVGKTQYADAFQRANFWDSVSTRSQNYHVLLETPTVLPAQTIVVPADKDLSGITPFTGVFLPRVDDEYVIEFMRTLVNQLNISPRILPIFLWGKVWSGTADGGYFAAEHFWASTAGGGVPFVATSYYSADGPRPFITSANVYPLSHEVLEWLDDPFTNNHTPGWDLAFQGPTPTCISSVSDILEAADPVSKYPESVIPIATSGFEYKVTDGVFIDYFTRAQRSRSVNGQYSMFNINHNNTTIAASPECVGDLHLDAHLIEVPGSVITQAFGINNLGDVVGLYADMQGNIHGFVMKNSRINPLDFPNAIATGAFGINDSGAVVGYFYDSQINLHGFLYKDGSFQQLDYLGAEGSFANKINASGDVVGDYYLAQSAHGYLFSRGTYQQIDSPFGSNTDLQAINDIGELGGGSWEPNNEVGFIFGHSGFRELSMPDALHSLITSMNNDGTRTGELIDLDLFFDGFIDLFGHLHRVNGDYDLTWDPQILFGCNDRNQVVGTTYNLNTGYSVGFIADLPLAGRRNGEGRSSKLP